MTTDQVIELLFRTKISLGDLRRECMWCISRMGGCDFHRTTLSSIETLLR